MAEIPKHARYATQALFDSAVSAGSVPSGAVCFIEDTGQIWVDGVYYTLDDAEIEEKISAALEGYYTKDEVSKLIGDLDQEVKDVVSDVSGLKTEVAGKADAFNVGYGLALEDSTLKVTIDPSLFVVCPDGLPSGPAEGEEDKIHLVPMEETEEGNSYEEWLWVNGSWELFGTLRTKVDLSNYLPLTGGTLTGKLTVNSSVAISGDLTVGGTVEITNDSGKPAVSIGSNADTTVHGDMTVEGDVTLESKLNVGGNASFNDSVYSDTGFTTDGYLVVHGDTTLCLAENADAPSVVVADDDGKLFRVAASAITDAEIDALFDE